MDMVWADVSAALAEQHRGELLAEVERHRLVKQILAQQRRTGLSAPCSRTRWWWFRKRQARAEAHPPAREEQQARRMLIPYYPARDQALVGKN